jgi:hypothetical protein
MQPFTKFFKNEEGKPIRSHLSGFNAPDTEKRFDGDHLEAPFHISDIQDELDDEGLSYLFDIHHQKECLDAILAIKARDDIRRAAEIKTYDANTAKWNANKTAAFKAWDRQAEAITAMADGDEKNEAIVTHIALKKSKLRPRKQHSNQSKQGSNPCSSPRTLSRSIKE